MFDLGIFGSGLAVALVLALIGWLLSLPLKNASIADSLWPLFFVLLGLTYALGNPEPAGRAWLVTLLLVLWGARLGAYITRRNWGEPEDRRYRAMRANHDPGFWWKSLYLVFGLQGALAWVISLPLLGAVLGKAPLGWLDYTAVLLWLVGVTFEAVGDQQLARFKAQPQNRGRVMDRGLWRYTRHPNYFGEACVWWAFFLFALAAGAWWAMVSPILMTWLLLRVSGVSLLELDIVERRPGYREYIERTNTFIPGPPRRPAADRDRS